MQSATIVHLRAHHLRFNLGDDLVYKSLLLGSFTCPYLKIAMSLTFKLSCVAVIMSRSAHVRFRTPRPLIYCCRVSTLKTHTISYVYPAGGFGKRFVIINCCRNYMVHRQFISLTKFTNEPTYSRRARINQTLDFFPTWRARKQLYDIHKY